MFTINDLSIPEIIGTNGFPVVEVPSHLFASLVELCSSSAHCKVLSLEEIPVVLSLVSYIQDSSVRCSVVNYIFSLYVDATSESIESSDNNLLSL